MFSEKTKCWETEWETLDMDSDAVSWDLPPESVLCFLIIVGKLDTAKKLVRGFEQRGLHYTKTQVNQVLYAHKNLFKNMGGKPPMWEVCEIELVVVLAKDIALQCKAGLTITPFYDASHERVGYMSAWVGQEGSPVVTGGSLHDDNDVALACALRAFFKGVTDDVFTTFKARHLVSRLEGLSEVVKCHRCV